jgi:hypothetical protein
MLSEAQRVARATRVGASEVSGLLGEHRYVQPHNIYDRIVLGESWTAEAGSPAWVGQRLEPHLLKMAREAFGLHARLTSRPAIHPTLPMSASADGFAKDYLVEVKVTSAWGFETKGLPSYVRDQCVVQAALYRKPVVHVVVLSGSRFWYESVEADAERFAVLEEAVADFERHHLIPHIRPPQPSDFRNAK